MRYTLTEKDISLVKDIARKRYEYNRRVKAKATIYGHKNITPGFAVYLEQLSYGGEVAFCRLFGLQPDTEIAGHPPYDAILPNGMTLDIKTTSLPFGMLIVKETGHTADLYALMVGSLPSYKLIGFAYKDEIINPDRWNTRLPEPAYAMRQNQLTPIIAGLTGVPA